MSILLFLFGGGAVTLAVGALCSLIGGRRLAFRACRVLASVATGLPLVLFVCAFFARDVDEDGRAAGMLGVSAIAMLMASLSCWGAVWFFRVPQEAPESNPGLNREGPQGPNS